MRNQTITQLFELSNQNRIKITRPESRDPRPEFCVLHISAAARTFIIRTKMRKAIRSNQAWKRIKREFSARIQRINIPARSCLEIFIEILSVRNLSL